MKTLGFSLFFTLSAITIVVVSCHPNNERLILDKAEEVIDDYPDSALQILSSIHKENLRRQKDYAYYSLLYAKALDKNYIDTTDVSVISPAVSFYENIHSTEKLALSLYYLGRIQQNSLDIKESMLSFTKAEKLLETINNPTLSYLLKMAIANNYTQSYNTFEELRYTFDALCLAKQHNLERYLLPARYRYAASLANNQKYDEALSIMDSLAADKNCPSYLRKRCFVRSCFYKTLSKRGDSHRLKDDFEIALSGDDYPMEVDDYCAYAYLLGLNGDTQAANNLFQRIKESFPNEGNIAAIWESSLAEKKGDYESAFKKLNTTLSEQDSIFRHTLQQSLSQTQKEYFQSELRETDHKRKQSRLTSLIVGLSAMLIICVLSFVLYWFWRYFSEKDSESKAKIDALSAAMKTIEEDKASAMEEIRKNYLSRMFRPLGERYSN